MYLGNEFEKNKNGFQISAVSLVGCKVRDFVAILDTKSCIISL
jgi:phage regulator Rha-like protein